MAIDYKQAAWSLLLAKGCVVAADQQDITEPTEDEFPEVNYINYWSGRPFADSILTATMLRDIEAQGIDWGKTSTPEDANFKAYEDTETEFQVRTLTGTLVINTYTSIPPGFENESYEQRLSWGIKDYLYQNSYYCALAIPKKGSFSKLLNALVTVDTFDQVAVLAELRTRLDKYSVGLDYHSSL